MPLVRGLTRDTQLLAGPHPLQQTTGRYICQAKKVPPGTGRCPPQQWHRDRDHGSWTEWENRKELGEVPGAPGQVPRHQAALVARVKRLLVCCLGAQGS